ncbi:hypothetical protein B0H14DRAFT_3784544 [Mycena olivaceomarginata]|nr:hypothetical protein B0H14DRAFT_3784544 [Mycena olivaceomarginata]
MFEAAETIPSGEIKAYRHFAFPPALGDPSHNPFFSVENASALITSHGYQLYLQHTDSESSLWDPDKATVNQIWGYRNYMLGDHFLGHLFFDLDNTEAWINLVAFQAYMNTFPAAVSTASLVPKSNQDQDSWGGSSGHSVGDSEVVGFLPDLTTAINARESTPVNSSIRVTLRVASVTNQIPAATQALWKAELDANEREAASAAGIVSRWTVKLTPCSSFYNQIMMSKCKVQCDGIPVFKRLSGGASYGKQFFIGCSKWTGAQKFEHRYLPIPNNVDEDTLRIAMENGGRLPTAPTVNENVCSHGSPANRKTPENVPWVD